MGSLIQIKDERMGLSIIYFKGSKSGIFHMSLWMFVLFTLAKYVDPDEMSHYAAFHLVYIVCQSTRLGFPVCKGLSNVC